MLYRRAASEPDLLPAWRWMVEASAHAFAWSSAGDVFLVHSDGTVWRLDPGRGALERLAESSEQFEEELLQPEIASKWLQLPLVSAFTIRHGPLRAGYCLGYATLPVLNEGIDGIENRVERKIEDHCGATGEIHCHLLQSLPAGMTVHIRVVERTA